MEHQLLRSPFCTRRSIWGQLQWKTSAIHHQAELKTVLEPVTTSRHNGVSLPGERRPFISAVVNIGTPAFQWGSGREERIFEEPSSSNSILQCYTHQPTCLQVWCDYFTHVNLNQERPVSQRAKRSKKLVLQWSSGRPQEGSAVSFRFFKFLEKMDGSVFVTSPWLGRSGRIVAWVTRQRKGTLRSWDFIVDGWTFI